MAESVPGLWLSQCGNTAYSTGHQKKIGNCQPIQYFHSMKVVIHLYLQTFRLPAIQKGYAGIVILLILSSLMTLLYQATTHSVCSTQMVLILVGEMLFWGSLTPLVYQTARLTRAFSKVMFLFLCLAVCLLIVNQLGIQYWSAFMVRVLYGCQLEGTWLTRMLHNNLLINFLCYTLLFWVGTGAAYPVPDSRNLPTSPPDPAIPTREQYVQQIRIKNGTACQWVLVGDIIWIEAANNCVVLHTKSQRHVVYQSLKSVQATIDPQLFVRIHRSRLVNRHFIHKIHHLPTGDADVELLTSMRLRMSRLYKKQIEGL
ncbi:LytR/AlgR family response regulator transcription factor [Larkinella sp. VNQ87]|uniref:LytR/AlgR family response regulator transcription factor n=1 Tax=Larkinella sp. VNQ87 TaxID=3400921 RepID=UPI003C0B927C